MAQRRVSKQNIIILTLFVILFALLVGITVAWFTDTATIQGELTLGSLNIKLQYYNGSQWVDSDEDSITSDAAVPGDTLIPPLRVIQGSR